MKAPGSYGVRCTGIRPAALFPFQHILYLLRYLYTWTRAGVSAYCTSRYNTASCSPERGRRNAKSKRGSRAWKYGLHFVCTRSKDDGMEQQCPGPLSFLLPAASCSLATEGRHKHKRRRINGRAAKRLLAGRDHLSARQWRRTSLFDRSLLWQLQPQPAATQDSPLSSRALRQEMPATLFAGGRLMGSRDWTALRQRRKGRPAQRSRSL